MWRIVFNSLLFSALNCEYVERQKCADGQFFYTTEISKIEPKTKEHISNLDKDYTSVHDDNRGGIDVDPESNKTHVCRLCVCSKDVRCISMPKYNCDYIEKLTKITTKPEVIDDSDKSELKYDIERRLFETLYKASNNPSYPSCVPLASQYTDCTKDNICLGCKRCSCGLKGEWTCNTVQLCGVTSQASKPSEGPASVLQRGKRSEAGIEQLLYTDSIPRTIPYTVYTEPSLIQSVTDAPLKKGADDQKKSSPKQAVPSKPNSKYYDKLKTKVDVEDLVFDDFVSPDNVHRHDLREYADDNMQMNDPINNHESLDDEMKNVNVILAKDPRGMIGELKYMQYDDIPTRIDVDDALNSSKEKNNTARKFETVVNDFELEYEEEEAKVPEPLLNTNFIEEIEMYPDIENYNKKAKRESVISKSFNNNHTTASKDNRTDSNKKIKGLLLYPLIKIINSKNRELYELKVMKARLIKFIKIYIDDSPFNITTDSFINDENSAYNKTQRIYSFGQNEFSMSKQVKRLKLNIANVINDILNIQEKAKLNNVSTPMNDDLHVLVDAMKQYVKKQMNTSIQIKGLTNNTRRNFIYTPVSISETENFGDNFDDILADVSKPSSGAFNTELTRVLSKDSLSVLRRIGEQLHPKETHLHTIPVFRTFNNLSEILKRISDSMATIKSQNLDDPSEKLSYLKYLYLQICDDISKIDNILAVLVFADSRKMISPDQDDRIEIIDEINHNLNEYSNKITDAVYSLNKNTSGRRAYAEPEERKKLIKTLKKFMKTSKDNIVNVFQKKIPKGIVARKVIQKRLESMAQKRVDEYASKLKEWQEKLNVISEARSKRSMSSLDLAFARKMQHFVPNYLRGKIFPALKGSENPKGHYNIENKVHSGSHLNSIPLKKH